MFRDRQTHVRATLGILNKGVTGWDPWWFMGRAVSPDSNAWKNRKDRKGI